MNSNDLCHRSGGERLGALTAGLEVIGTTAAMRRAGTSARRPLASASAHQNFIIRIQPAQIGGRSVRVIATSPARLGSGGQVQTP